MLEHEHVDLLITDYMMPDMTGLELIRWLKTASPGTRTILMTALSSDKINAEARSLEVDRFLTKPFNYQELSSAVDGALCKSEECKPTVTTMSLEQFEAISQRLSQLCADISASHIFLSDMQGQQLAEWGPPVDIEGTTLLALLAGGAATSAEVARRCNEGDAVNLTYQEGGVYEIYSCNVGNRCILAVLFDRREQRSHIGMVWLYARRAVDDLQQILIDLNSETPVQFLEEGFDASVMAELNNTFIGEEIENAEVGTPLDGTVPPVSVTLGRNESSPPDKLLSLDEAIAKGLLSAEFGAYTN